MCLTLQMQVASVPDLSLCSRQMGALLLVFTVTFLFSFCEESSYLETADPVFCMALHYENSIHQYVANVEKAISTQICIIISDNRQRRRVNICFFICPVS